MTGPATYAVPPTFLGIGNRDPDAPLCVAGIPLDIGTTNRSGARFGPAAIRQASRMLVDGDHPQHWIDPATLPLADIGDFAIALGDIAASMTLIEEQALRRGITGVVSGEDNHFANEERRPVVVAGLMHAVVEVRHHRAVGDDLGARRRCQRPRFDVGPRDAAALLMTGHACR